MCEGLRKLPFGIRFAEVQETVEDIDIKGGYIMTLAVSTEVVIYRDASPYTRLYSFRSESRAYGRRKRLTIVYAERNELSFVLIGSTSELWKVILPGEESQGNQLNSHQYFALLVNTNKPNKDLIG